MRRHWAVVGLACLGLPLAWAPPAAAARPESRVTKSILPNRLVLLVKPNPASDLVAVHAFVGVPCTVEAERAAGLRQLLSQMLVRGTTQRSGGELARTLEAAGGALTVAFGLDYVDARAVTTADGFELVVDLLADVLRNPIFDGAELERQRATALARVDAVRDDPFQSAYFLAREALYGDHPYGLPNFGTPSGLRAVTREMLVALHREYFVPGNTVIAISGRVSHAQAHAAVARALGTWPAARAPQGAAPEFKPLQRSERRAAERPLRSAALMIAFPGPAVSHPDYPAVQVIDALLGGGTASRLFVELRDKRGLAYEVSSFYPSLAYHSHLAVYLATAPESLDSAKREIVRQVESLQREPVAEAELERAKRFLIGSYALGHQRNSDQAFYLGWYETVGVGWEFDESYAGRIAAVTADQVRQAAQTWFRAYAVAVLMPRSEGREAPEKPPSAAISGP